MVLLGIANANYEFLYVNFGTNGRVSDGGVIENTDFHDLLLKRQLKLPPENSRNGLPYVFISDEAFALRNELMKPFNVRDLDDRKRIYNYRLSRARRVIENVFGILVSRFGVLKTPIGVKPENIVKIVMACCVLHNFLRKKAAATYTPPDSLDYEDTDTFTLREGLRCRDDKIAALRPNQHRRAHNDAKEVRDSFMDFFNTTGSVPWQHKVLQ